MSRPEDEKILEFMKDLHKLQKKHDFWLCATEDNPIWVSNDSMDGEEIKIFWDKAFRKIGMSKKVESTEVLTAVLEPDRLSTTGDENET